MTALTTSAAEAVVVEDGDGPLRWVTINRPGVHNALNRAVFDALDDVWVRAAADPDLRGPRATARVLGAVRAGDGLAPGLDHELLLASMAIGSAEAAEGVAAFRERRSPSFPRGER